MSQTPPIPPSDRSAPVLLVDDEEEYVLTLAERLAARDIPAVVAYDGEQALGRLLEERPEVMVLDLRMPGLDGMEVLRRVKRSYPRVEVIIVTGHGTDHEARMARELGAFAYLKKPVKIEVLVDLLRAASRRARSERVEHDVPDPPDSIPSEEGYFVPGRGDG